MKVTVGDVTNNKCNVREYLTCDEDGTIFVDLDALDTVLIDKSNEWDNLQRELADIKSMMPKDKHTLIKSLISRNRELSKLRDVIRQDSDKIQELEDKNDILRHSINDVSGAAGFMLKKSEQQNKRYRERVAQLINYIEMTDDETDRQVHKIHVILDGLLEESE